MSRLVILFFLTWNWFGCQAAPEGTADPTPTHESAEPKATEVALSFEVQVPSPRGPAANFVVRRDGQAGYERAPTRVRVDDKEELVPLGKRRTFRVAASEVELQRIYIDGHDFLVEVVPGEELSLWDNPCNGWQLSVPRADANAAAAPDVRCVSPAMPCTEGFSPSPQPGLANDPLCADDERRCVHATTITVVGEGVEADGERVANGETIERGPTVCDFSEVRTREDRVRLMPPIGSHWQIEAVGGEIVGRVVLQ